MSCGCGRRKWRAAGLVEVEVHAALEDHHGHAGVADQGEEVLSLGSGEL